MIPFLLASPLVLVLAILTAVLGVGRLTRIITYDAFPPAVWWRIKWAEITNDGPWVKLFTCFWCLPPWIMAVCIGWFIAGYHVAWIGWTWWLFWAWLGLSYLVSWFVARDEPAEH